MSRAVRRSLRPWTRLAAAVSVTAAVATVSPSALATPPQPVPKTLAELRADVTKTGDRLAAATVAWERGQLQLGILIQQKISARQAGEQLQFAAQEAQKRVSALAASYYRNPVDPMITAVFSGDTHAIADVTFVRRALGLTNNDRQRDANVLTNRAARAQELFNRQEDATVAATRLQAELDDQLSLLQADAQSSAVRLQAAVEEVRRREALVAASAFGDGEITGSGATCSGPVPLEALNGFLPISALCALRTVPGHRLIASAARAFDEMSAAFTAALGKPLCVTDSYRDYAGQVRVFKAKPELAATPGRSQHGLGKALDLCGGVQNFGTPAYNWLKQNSMTYGYVHPDWAEPGGSRPEPWHWEFQG